MQYATPPKFGTQPIEEGDDLFVLQRYTCADCGATFETSRYSARCALCASMRRGQVGPANVTCRACGVEHQVPILAPSKLCQACRADLDATARHITQVLEATEARFYEAVERWDADCAHAEARDQERYRNVVAARAVTPAAEFGRKYDRAFAKGDGLSLLLQSKERCDAVAVEVERVRSWASAAMEEVLAARSDV